MKQDMNGVRTAQDLERKYDLAGIEKLKQDYNSQNQEIKEVNNELKDFVSSVTETIGELQDQVDGNITTWFYSGVPTLQNEPASSWNTNEEKNNHLGDLYYDKETGYAYRFSLENSTYSWLKLTDSDVTEALALANSAKDTADSKRRVFLEQPVPPYDNGDMWIKNNEIYICQISKPAGQTFAENDFINNLKYTDDTYAIQVGQDLTVLSGSVLEIKNDVDEHTTKITQTQELVNEQGEQIGVLGQQYTELQQTTSGLTITVGQTSATLEQQQQDITNINTNLNTTNQNVSSLQGTVNNQATEIGNLNTQIGTTNQTVSNLQGTVNTQTGQISNLNGQVETANQNISNLQGTVGEQTESINHLNEDYSQLEQSTNELNTVVIENQNNIASQQTDISNLNSSLSSTNSELNQVKNDLSTANSTINEMKYTFTTDELKIQSTNDPINSALDNQGIRVYNYATLKSVLNDKGSGFDDLIVTNTAQIGYLKFVKATDENNEPVTDIHHLVSNIQNVEDLL